MSKIYSTTQKKQILENLEKWPGTMVAFCEHYNLAYTTVLTWARKEAKAKARTEAAKTEGEDAVQELTVLDTLGLVSRLLSTVVEKLEKGDQVSTKGNPIEEDEPEVTPSRKLDRKAIQKTVDYVNQRGGEVFVSELAKAFNISGECASMRLRSAVKRGLIEFRERGVYGPLQQVT